MKLAKRIYEIMNVVMIVLSIVMAVIGMKEGFSALYLIIPVVTTALFVIMELKKTQDELKKLMQAVFSSHIAVMLAVTQALFAFKVDYGNIVILLAVTAGLIAFMVWALTRMFKKMEELAALSAKAKEESGEEDNSTES